MTETRTPFEDNTIDALFRRVSALEEKLAQVANDRQPTVPFYDNTNFPATSQEGQIALDRFDHTAWAKHFDGEWRQIGASTLDTVQLIIPKLCWWQGNAIVPFNLVTLDPTDSTGTRDGDWSYVPLTRAFDNPDAGQYIDPYGAFHEFLNEFGVVRSVGLQRPGIYLAEYRLYINNDGAAEDANVVTAFGKDGGDHINVQRVWGYNASSGADVDDAEATNAELHEALSDDGSIAFLTKALGEHRFFVAVGDHSTYVELGDGGVCLAYRHDGPNPIDCQALMTIVRLGDASHPATGDLDQTNHKVYGIHVPDTVDASSLVTVTIDGDSNSFTVIVASGTGILTLAGSSNGGLTGDEWFDDLTVGTTPGDDSLFGDDFEGGTITPPWDNEIVIGTAVVSHDSGKLKIHQPASEFGVSYVNKEILFPTTWAARVKMTRSADGIPGIGISIGDTSINVTAFADGSGWYVLSSSGTGDEDTVTTDMTIGSSPADTEQLITIEVAPA